MFVSTASRDSGQRRRVVRVEADLRIVIAFRDGSKTPARVIDVSTGGMNVRADRRPEYGEALTVIVQLRESADWYVIPAAVRWFSQGGFGVSFEGLDAVQARALAAFVDQAAG